MATVNKNNLSDPIVTATLSVPNETTVIYGQQFYLDVTLRSELYFPQGLFLEVTAKSTGITIVPIGEAPVSSGLEKSIVGHYEVAIDVFDANTITDGLVLFTVKFSSSEIIGYDNDFEYYVKKILLHSLQLQPDKLACVIPEKYSAPQINDPQDTYIIYEAQLLEDTGNTTSNIPLKNALIYLVSSPDTDITTDIIITSDSYDNTASLITYAPENHYNEDFISLISDAKTGKIRFRVYSNNKMVGNVTNYKPTLLSLGCEILGNYPTHMSTIALFIAPRPKYDFENLDELYIPDADSNGVIHGVLGESSFEGIIQSNVNYKNNDRLLFFTKEKNNIPDVNSLIPPIYRMNGVDDNYSYPIPYKYFKINEWTDIFYVITNRGYTHYSKREIIKYTGGGSNLEPNYTLKFELINGNEILDRLQSQKVRAILTGTGEGVNIANRKLNLSIDGRASFKADSRVQTTSVNTHESGVISFELYDSNQDGEVVTLVGYLDNDNTSPAIKKIHFQRYRLIPPDMVIYIRTIFIYSINDQLYLLRQCKADYMVTVHKLTEDGRQGEQTSSGQQWDLFYDLMFPFVLGEEQYFFGLANNSLSYPYGVKSRWIIAKLDEKGHKKIVDYDHFSSSYDVGAAYVVNRKQFIYLHSKDKKNTGQYPYVVYEISSNGVMDRKPIEQNSWDNFYEAIYIFKIKLSDILPNIYMGMQTRDNFVGYWCYITEDGKVKRFTSPLLGPLQFDAYYYPQFPYFISKNFYMARQRIDEVQYSLLLEPAFPAWGQSEPNIPWDRYYHYMIPFSIGGHQYFLRQDQSKDHWFITELLPDAKMGRNTDSSANH